MVRLQKFLSEAGVASRRAAERMILEGRVAVDGETVREMGTKVDPARSRVEVDGQPVNRRKKIYIALHKPVGFVCTRSDPENRRIVMDLLPHDKQHVFPVGRLDRASEGLLILTNDGEFSLKMTHPRYGVRKAYIVILEGKVDPAITGQLTRGIRDYEDFLKAESATVLSSSNSRTILEVILTEGKNREIRRLMKAFDVRIERLIRARIGNLKLDDLPVGKWRTLTETEIKSLLAR